MAVALMAVVGLTGCGDGSGQGTDAGPDENTPPSTPLSGPDESTATASASPATADVNEFCQTLVDAEAALTQGPDIDLANASPEAFQEALQAFGEELNPLLDDLVASAPEDIAADVEALVDAIRSGLETGEDPSLDPAFMEAETAVTDYTFEECGFETVDVTAVDYDFEGVPDTIASGDVTGFLMSNEGAEVHEMVIFNLGDDERPIDELLALPAEELGGVINFVGGAFAGPGGEDGTFLELEPGRHAMVCFIPVGTESLEQLQEGPPPEEEGAPSEAASAEPSAGAEGSGAESEAPPGGGGGEPAPPHFTQGMVVEFTVE